MARLGAGEVVVAARTERIGLVARWLVHAERILRGRWRRHWCKGRVGVVIEGGSWIRGRGGSCGIGGEGVPGGGGLSRILDGALRRRGKGVAVSRRVRR